MTPRIKGFELLTNTIHLSERQRPDCGVPAPLLVTCEPAGTARAWNQTAFFVETIIAESVSMAAIWLPMSPTLRSNIAQSRWDPPVTNEAITGQ